MSIQSRRWLQAILVITLICVLISVFIIARQSVTELTAGDNTWYLNRATLIWHGVLPDLFVYTLAFPSVIGLINFAVHDIFISAIAANGAALWLTLIGTYVLACWLYGSKRIAWLAVLLIATNSALCATLRLFSPYAAFTAAATWCIVAALLVIRRPGYLTAALLGIVLALALYTRFEGVVYTLAIPLVVWEIHRQRQNRPLALQVLLTTGIVVAVLATPFVVNFALVRANQDMKLSINVTGVLTLLNRTPIEWSVIWRRVTDSLTSLLIQWPVLAWIVLIAGAVWAAPRYKSAQWFCIGLVIFNLIYEFVLDIWPYPSFFSFSLPLAALMIAAALNQLMRRGNGWKLAALPVVALIIWPGLFSFAVYSTDSAPLSYRTSDLVQTGVALDLWLQEQGWAQIHIYTFCGGIPLVSHASIQLLYRLAFTTGWDTPDRLIPQMRAEGALLMVCGGSFNPFPDWRALLQQKPTPGIHEIGRFDHYIFYQPNPP